MICLLQFLFLYFCSLCEELTLHTQHKLKRDDLIRPLEASCCLMSKFRNGPHKYMIFSDHFHLDSFCDCFLCLDVRVWGGFSEPSLLGMDCPTMLTVGRRAEASSDCCSCSSPIVAALYAMS